LKEENTLLKQKNEVIKQTEKKKLSSTYIKIASWNLKNASYSRNKEKIKTISQIIKEINPDVIALQEIASPGKTTIDELKKYLGNGWEVAFQLDSRPGSTCLAFVWKTEKLREGRTRGSVIHPADYQRDIYYKTFEWEKHFTFKLVNLHLRPNGSKEHCTEIQKLDQVERQTKEGNCSIILIGDFNEYPCNDRLKEKMYENIIRPHQYTNVNGTFCFDNIIVPYPLYLCCKEHDVYKSNNIELPNFDHFPVYASFFGFS